MKIIKLLIHKLALVLGYLGLAAAIVVGISVLFGWRGSRSNLWKITIVQAADITEFLVDVADLIILKSIPRLGDVTLRKIVTEFQ